MPWGLDARNRLAALSAPALTGGFAYDALGRRIRRVLGGEAREYQYDGVDIIHERFNGVEVGYLRGLGLDEPFVRADSEYILQDVLGSVIALTDTTGLAVTTYTYEPFGRATVQGASSSNSFQYAGRESEAGTLYYYRARYHHPVLARFLSEDPLGLLQAVHLYAYASNNPITFLDLLGLITWPGRGGVTSPFGERGGRFPGFHNGADIGNPNGGPVAASEDGRVIPVRQDGPGGNQVGILHAGGRVTIYSHTNPLVKPGDLVKEGQPIGCTDASGRSEGNHVHFISYPKGLQHPPADPVKDYLPPENNYPKNLFSSSVCSGGGR